MRGNKIEGENEQMEEEGGGRFIGRKKKRGGDWDFIIPSKGRKVEKRANNARRRTLEGMSVDLLCFGIGKRGQKERIGLWSSTS